MGQKIIYTCPKCGHRMMQMGDDSVPGAPRYFCTNTTRCGWVKYMDTEHYKFIPITDYEKYKNEVEK